MPKLQTRIVVVIAAIALVASGVYAGYFHDQSIKAVYASLEPQISQLKNDLKNRDAQISSLNSELAPVVQQIRNLQAASMGGWFTFTEESCFPKCNATVRGAWTNYGTQSARNVVVTFTWSHSNAIFQTNSTNIGVVAGRSTVLYRIPGLT